MKAHFAIIHPREPTRPAGTYVVVIAVEPREVRHHEVLICHHPASFVLGKIVFTKDNHEDRRRGLDR